MIRWLLSRVENVCWVCAIGGWMEIVVGAAGLRALGSVESGACVREGALSRHCLMEMEVGILSKGRADVGRGEWGGER